MHDAFDVLGLSPGAPQPEIRKAFRRLALRHHPDRNPDDPRATTRFRRILGAYRQAMSYQSSNHPATADCGPERGRYECDACGDSFSYPAACPRCDIPLVDRQTRKRAQAPTGGSESFGDPRIDRWVAALQAQRRWRPPAFVDRLPKAWLLAGAFLTAGLTVWWLGPVGPAVLFAGYGLFVAGAELHRRWATIAWSLRTGDTKS